MNRRNFLGAMLATVAGCVLAKKVEVAPVAQAVVGPMDDGECLVEFGTHIGTQMSASYLHMRAGDKKGL